MNISNISIGNAYKMLIQPDWVSYSIDNLGPKLICFTDNDSYRRDFVYKNSRGNTIYCSLFIPIKRKENVNQNYEKLKLHCPCVVYSHSQSGNRIEGSYL